MSRAALLVCLCAGSAGAATLAECDALVKRLAVEVRETGEVAGVCLFTDLRFGTPPNTWRAATVSLGGDVDALPDALPSRLTGGVSGLTLDPQIPGQPGLVWLMREQAAPGMAITFDVTVEAGVVRLNSFVLRVDDSNEIALTARLAGVPEVWPVDPVALAALRLQALDLDVVFDGMFEALVLLPMGAALLDLTQDAEPQIAALRAQAAAFLTAFAETPQAENADAAQAFLDALPHPRGLLEVSIGGTGLSAVQLGPLANGTPSTDFISRVAEAADLDIFWTPDAP